MKKRMLLVILAFTVLVMGVFGLTACNNSNDEAITNLQQQIAELQEQIKNLLDKTENMEEEFKNLNDRINELEQQNVYGRFYTLQEAYDNRILTKNDLEQIAYYNNEGLKFPETLDGSIEELIKNDFAYDLRHRADHPIEEANAEGIEIYSYYGEYSGSYIFRLRTIYWDYPAIPHEHWEEIGGVEFHIIGFEQFYVWKNK